MLADPERQEINGQVKVTWRTLQEIANSIMVYEIVLYLHFALIYTTYYIFPVLPIKDLISKYSETTKPFKLATGTKNSVSHLRVLFCPHVVWKATAHVKKKALNMRHQAQKCFCGIFVEIPQNQKGYVVYVPSTKKIISSYDVVFDEMFSSMLVYTS